MKDSKQSYLSMQSDTIFQGNDYVLINIRFFFVVDANSTLTFT